MIQKAGRASRRLDPLRRDPILEIRGVWFLGKEVGPFAELTDALVTEYSEACPF